MMICKAAASPRNNRNNRDRLTTHPMIFDRSAAFSFSNEKMSMPQVADASKAGHTCEAMHQKTA
jgi:hypothetical protein